MHETFQKCIGYALLTVAAGIALALVVHALISAPPRPHMITTTECAALTGIPPAQVLGQ